MTDAAVVELPPPAPLEFRYAETLDVRFPDRTIEVVAVPYDEETVVDHRGRPVIETIAPGSFDGIERRANRVKVNRDHDRNRTVGRAIAFHTGRSEGLVAELRIGRGALGDETLEYAADGILDASIGFAPFPGHEHWAENRQRRRITKAWLGHIAMVPEPAYDGAQVLAVRHLVSDVAVAAHPSATVATPNLDRLRDILLEEKYNATSGRNHIRVI